MGNFVIIRVAGVEFQGSRKLRKFVKRPKEFFFDMRGVGRFLQVFIRTDKDTKVAKTETVARIGSNVPDINIPGWENFDLRGDDWLDSESAKPVAVLWGFNPWKRDFVARYLVEYRVAYARGRSGWGRLLKKLDQLKDRELRFIVWGMSETSDVREYAEHAGLPLYRMEDGFIRSTALGSQHSMPLSLVLDKEGIYFDASRPSDLERLLNEYDFNREPELMDAAESLLGLMRELRVSKYNLGNLQSPSELLGPWIRPRVLVIGQVEGDASIEYGSDEAWTNYKLIELARAENPSADIAYKPHPDVVKGFRKNSQLLTDLQKICQILSGDLVLADLFREVDQVYTITSLSGFEALLYGLPVTVVGAPFYAGWGLTDDRAAVTRRRRRLSLEQLFCGAYLLYPRYLTNPEDPVQGCLAAMLEVVAGRKLSVHDMISAKTIGQQANSIAKTSLWPVLLTPKNLPVVSSKYKKTLSSLLPIRKIFAHCEGEYYQRTVGYLLAGKFVGLPAFGRVMDLLHDCMRPEHFHDLLVDLWAVAPSSSVLWHWARLAETTGDIDRARQALSYIANNGSFKTAGVNTVEPIKRAAPIVALAQFELRQKNFDEAYQLFCRLLLSQHVEGDVIVGITEIARLRFDFASGAELLRIFNNYGPRWKSGKGHLQEAQAHSLAGNPMAALESIAVACKLNPKYMESVSSMEEMLAQIAGKLPYDGALLDANVLASDNTIALAKALLVSNRAADAEQLLMEYKPDPAEQPLYCVTLSLAYSYQGKFDEAKTLLIDQIQRYPWVLLYREGLRTAILNNDYEWGNVLLKDAEARNINVGDMYYRKVALGLGDIQGSYHSFRNMRAVGVLQAYIGGRYVQSLDAVTNSNKAEMTAAILALFGPGDEIRFASLYREMRARAGHSRVVFTCDPRLLSLLQRHYTDLEFVPVTRVRNLAWLDDHSDYNQLPGSDLHTFLDNSGWELVKNADASILATDALGDVIKGYDSFRGTPYLKADPAKTIYWQERLADHKAKLLVGLSWRSSLTTYSRSEHYFSVKELAPLFELEGVHFINLQYDECDEEIAWLETCYPGRITHFSDLDQYNDLEGVAALMCCLDLVIAPATTVVELSGALGCPTWLLSNSSELHWRKIPGTKTDVWHNSIHHMEGEELGDKASVISTVYDALVAHRRGEYQRVAQTVA